MNIRKAKPGDASVIAKLLKQLDYTLPEDTIRRKIERFENDRDELLLVYAEGESVVAFISIRFIPQIAFEGDFARIGCFCVDEAYRSKRIGEKLESYCVGTARSRGCDRIELHDSRRTDAHRFYESHGYGESPKYFVKHLKQG